MHMLRADDPGFTSFGEIYFSRVYPGVVKGWHIHDRMTLNYAVRSQYQAGGFSMTRRQAPPWRVNEFSLARTTIDCHHPASGLE